MARLTEILMAWPVLLVQAALTLGAATTSLVFAGALLFSGRPEPTPAFLYVGFLLIALTIPMIVALILRLTQRGRAMVILVQWGLAVGNLLFWGALLVLLVPQLSE